MIPTNSREEARFPRELPRDWRTPTSKLNAREIAIAICLAAILYVGLVLYFILTGRN